MAENQRFGSQPRVALPGSERKPFTEHPAAMHAFASAASAGADEPITVTVVLRPQSAVDTSVRLDAEQFAKQHGPDAASVQVVKDFAREFGLTVAEDGATGTCVHLTGTLAAMEAAFGTTLQHETHGGQELRLREGSIFLPQEVAAHVVAVLGLDNRPQAKPHFRVAHAKAVSSSYTPVQIAQLYGFPAGAKAAGQTIALIELGGGFRPADVTAYFKSLNLPAPSVTAVSVDKGKNTPGNANGADGEVMLDIEVAAAVAPGAAVAVYFAPNTDQGFIDAINMAIHDKTHKPSVISISWGGPESSWTGQAMTALDQTCQAAAALGVTITAAAGDDGSTDGVSGTANHVDFPASSPHVLACGGTRITASASAITAETVWNELAQSEGATGGGVSAVFPLPAWQASAKVPKGAAGGGRGVPDVAGDADPATGYVVRVDGQQMVIGGTSAVAPLWAGLIALANAQNKRAAGFVNPVLYAAGAKAAFRDITSGSNGGFSAAPGWDACTGLGSPHGAAVIKVLGGSAAATHG